MTQQLTERYSIEKHVGHTFPPTFIFAAKDDEGVAVANSYLLDRALEAAEVICHKAWQSSSSHLTFFILFMHTHPPEGAS
jgi:hypothetical protein